MHETLLLLLLSIDPFHDIQTNYSWKIKKMFLVVVKGVRVAKQAKKDF